MADQILVHSELHDIVYIDPNLKFIDGGREGDGSAPSNALWDFPDEMTGNKLYLVRRSQDKYFAKFPMRKTFSSPTSLVIWGMPKEGTENFDRLPSAVRTAWKDTNRENAYLYFDIGTTNVDTVSSDYNSDYYTKFTNVKNVMIHDIIVQKSYSYVRYAQPLGFTSPYGVNLDVQRCTFMQRVQTEFSQSQSYIDSGDFTEGVNNESSHCDSYLGIYGYNCPSHSVKFVDCKINSSINRYNYNKPVLFELGYTNYIELRNIEVNAMGCYNIESRTIFHFGTNNQQQFKRPTLMVNNINYRIWDGTNNDSRGFRIPKLISGMAKHATVQNITVKRAENQLNTDKTFPIYSNNIIDLSLISPGSLIEDIDIDITPCNGVSDCSLIWIRNEYLDGSGFYYNYPPYGQYTWVRRIEIKYGGTRSSGSSYGENLWDDNYNFIYESQGYSMVSLSTYQEVGRHPSFDIMVSELNIKCTDQNQRIAYAAGFVGCLIDMKLCEIDGYTMIRNSVGKIGTISVGRPGYAVYDGGGNLLYVKTLNCNRQNPNFEYNGQNAIVPYYTSNILVNSCNVRMMPNTFSDNTYNACTYICTNDGTEGNYTVRTAQHICETWSIYRTGSRNNCSLKLSNETNENLHFPLYIGGEPFKGITLNVDQPGKYKATIYLIMNGYNDFSMIKDRMRIKILLPNGTVTSNNTVLPNAGNFVCSNEGNWYIDVASQWNNIDEYEGMTEKYKCEIPFEIKEGETGEIEFEYQFSWYMVGAATFVDPWPVITRLS